MKRTLGLFVLCLAATSAFAQSPSAPPDPYKPVLDRLQSITVIPLPSWQIHAADLAHGEDPALSVSDWQTGEAEARLAGLALAAADVRSPGAIERLQPARCAHLARPARQQRRRDSGERLRQRLDGGAHRRRRPGADHAHRERAARPEAGARGARAGLRRWRMLRRQLNANRARRTCASSRQPTVPIPR